MIKQFYGLEDPTPPWLSLVLGLQHVLGMFVGIITPPLLVAGALKLSLQDTAFLVSMSLFTSGVTTFVQVHRFGPVGSGMLSVTGPSFVFVPLAIQSGLSGGLPAIFGMALVGSVVPMLVSRGLNVARRLFPPVVTGTVVTLIGVGLIQVGFTEMAGGYGAPDFGSPYNMGLGFFVFAVIAALHALGRGFLRTVSIAAGLLAGYLVAAAAGRLDLQEVAAANWLHVPAPLHYGLSFDAAFLLPWLVGYLATSLECIGDLSATSAVSKEPVEGPVFLDRVRGGLLSDGLGCVFTALFNAMPKTTFSQNNGIIAMTGVASRRVGVAVAGLLVLLGLFPKLAALISLIPRPVLGGATVLMFSMVAVAGLHIVEQGGFNGRVQFILAAALALGLGVQMVPTAMEHLVQAVEAQPRLAGLAPSAKVILESGLTVGALTAVLLNLVMPPEPPPSGAHRPS